MPDTMQNLQPARIWPPGLTRTPFWAYQDPSVLEQEQTRLFQGPTWNFLCLEVDIPNPGDWRTTFVGLMPVVVVRLPSRLIVTPGAGFLPASDCSQTSPSTVPTSGICDTVY